MARRARLSDRDLQDAILVATRKLLDQRPFDQIAVADILTAARISRGSFYFYFESKHAVLAELVRRAIAEGHAASRSWLDHSPDTDEAPRSRPLCYARSWRTGTPIPS